MKTRKRVLSQAYSSKFVKKDGSTCGPQMGVADLLPIDGINTGPTGLTGKLVPNGLADGGTKLVL